MTGAPDSASPASMARHLVNLVEDLSMRTVKGRVARLLLDEAQASHEDVVPRLLTQEEMAARLGTVREMVGRALRSLTLSADVSDTAWASYLRGDRGIFTRRAVNLLESGEARAIAQIFENDGDFREHVSRYIHDFEAILRQVLSTRDGHALGVTLLSSDMGKLYVALAQSIERLRD